jgi:hypothetical protein
MKTAPFTENNYSPISSVVPAVKEIYSPLAKRLIISPEEKEDSDVV